MWFYPQEELHTLLDFFFNDRVWSTIFLDIEGSVRGINGEPQSPTQYLFGYESKARTSLLLFHPYVASLRSVG